MEPCVDVFINSNFRQFFFEFAKNLFCRLSLFPAIKAVSVANNHSHNKIARFVDDNYTTYLDAAVRHRQPTQSMDERVAMFFMVYHTFFVQPEVYVQAAATPGTSSIGSTAATAAAAVPQVTASSATSFSSRLLNQLPRRRVAVVILSGSYSHATAPVEYSKVLASRGHTIDWMSMEEEMAWIGKETTKQFPTFHTVSLGSYASTPLNNASMADDAFRSLCEGPWYALDRVKTEVFDAFWEHAYLALMKHWENPTTKPDLVACDMFATACMDAALKLNLPYVILVDTGLGIFGAGDALDTPGLFNEVGVNMNLWQRFDNLFFSTPRIIFRLGQVERVANAARAKYGIPPTLTPTDRWIGHEWLFCSSFAFDWPRPLPPYVHVIGPMYRTGEQVAELESTHRSFLAAPPSDSSLGTSIVYIGLGSRAMLNQWQTETLLQGLLECPDPTSKNKTLRVIMSTDPSTLPSAFAHHPGLLASKWLPQQALLESGSISAFLSHGGISSIQESMMHGVPLLILPFFGDQMVNAMKLIDAGVALRLQKQAFTSEEVCTKITQLMVSPTIKKEVERVQLLHAFNGNGNIRGADILERAATVGSQHLFPHGEQQPFLIRTQLDCYLLLAAIILTIIFIIRRVWRWCRFAIGGGSTSTKTHTPLKRD